MFSSSCQEAFHISQPLYSQPFLDLKLSLVGAFKTLRKAVIQTKKSHLALLWLSLLIKSTCLEKTIRDNKHIA